jgi:hypothetical protein
LTHWTEADQAELDVLLWEFSGIYWEHRDRCRACRSGLGWCEPMQKTFDVVLDWKRARGLRSRAEQLAAERVAV